MYLNDIEDEFYLNGIAKVDIHHIIFFYFFMPMIPRYFQKNPKGYKKGFTSCIHTVKDGN